MRFDDTIATVLAQPAGRADQREAQWRQLVDLLAQRRSMAGGPEVERAYAALREGRPAVPLEARRRAAAALAGLSVSPDLLAFFAEDRPEAAQPLLGAARLPTGDWLALLPRLGPTARSLLRHRRDLPRDVVRALGAFGSADLVLEGGRGTETTETETEAAPSPAAARSESQIRDLVERIEAYRRGKTAAPEPSAGGDGEPDEADEEPCDSFRWETGPEGLILWVEGADRGPLVGQTIASIAGRGQFGVDGQAAGAFEKRAPFRDARFRAAGAGPASGDWRISGVPYFDPRRGSFLGYRGTARRPRVDEVARAGAAATGVFGTEFPADSLRQLIHELRTPLNAIVGFAEMIEGQYMGPAGASYRGRAGEIVEQASRLLSAVDDLDTAARIESRRLDLGASATDAVALLCRLHDSYERVARERGATLAVEIAAGLPPARIDPGAAERMFARLLAGTIGLAQDGETIAASLGLNRGAEPMLCLTIERPRAIAGIGEEALLDPGYSPDGDWPGAPALGLGFALRLVRNLAEAAGGRLRIGEKRFSLLLPAAASAEREPERGGEGSA